jgi:hypothetical protein
MTVGAQQLMALVDTGSYETWFYNFQCTATSCSGLTKYLRKVLKTGTKVKYDDGTWIKGNVVEDAVSIGSLSPVPHTKIRNSATIYHSYHNPSLVPL